MKTLCIIAGCTLVALGCAPNSVVASPGGAEGVVAQLEQSAAELAHMASSLNALEVRQAELEMRMGGLFDQLPDRHAGLEAVARGIAELAPAQASWGEQMDAVARASEPNWALLTSGDEVEAALGRVPAILDAPAVDTELRAREARLLEQIGGTVAAPAGCIMEG